MRATTRRPPVRSVGTEPDPRFTYANERTFLAWIRTGLALVGGGLAVAQLLPDLGPDAVRRTLAAVLIAIGMVLSLRSYWHWERNERAMRLGQPLLGSGLPLLLGIAVGLASGLLLVMVLAEAS